MSTRRASEIVIGRAEPHQRQCALELLFGGQGTIDCPPGAPQLVTEAAAEGPRSDRLFVAQRHGQLVGSIGANVLAGRCATVFVPQLAGGESEIIASRLLEVLMSHLCTDGVNMAQSLLSPSDRAGARRLVQHGFVAIAEIHYLASPSTAFPHRAPSGPLTFTTYGDEQRGRLAKLVERTYHGTLDCPQLNGLRDVRDVLDGYRQIGEFHTQHWLFARQHNRDVGCLLLADHPAHGHMELVYMGLVPTVRGRGWGTIIVRHAQWLAGQNRRQQLVVTVDGKNTPAIEIYRAAGFIPWDRRLVLIKDLRDGPQAGFGTMGQSAVGR